VGKRTPIGFQGQLSANTAENPLTIPTGIPYVLFLVLSKSCSLKTVQHPTFWIFALEFCADDESLLTQAEEDKEKYKRKDECGAVGVRFPTA
jgi:hypothetical protein